jgi:hypothetical protein
MNTVIIVSICLRVTNFDLNENIYEFHFKGVCAGESLRRVLLRGQRDLAIKRGDEYLLYVNLHSIEKGILRGQIIKSKPIDQCWDKS